MLLEFQITQSRHSPSISDGKMSLSSTPVIDKKENMKRAQNERCSSSMSEQSLCKV